MIERTISMEKARERLEYWEELEKMMDTDGQRELARRMQDKFRKAIEEAQKNGR